MNLGTIEKVGLLAGVLMVTAFGIVMATPKNETQSKYLNAERYCQVCGREHAQHIIWESHYGVEVDPKALKAALEIEKKELELAESGR